MYRLLDRTLQFILERPLLFWICIVANGVGVVWGGWIWYGPQLSTSPLWAWPFIPDCPEAALFASLALIGLFYGRSWGWFNAFAAFASVKYGLWTIAFWLLHWSQVGFVDGYWPMEMMLFVSHIGLAGEGLLLMTRVGSLKLPTRLAILGWFVLSIGVDYGLGHHPQLTYAVPVSFALGSATLLTALLGLFLLLAPRMRVETTGFATAWQRERPGV